MVLPIICFPEFKRKFRCGGLYSPEFFRVIRNFGSSSSKTAVIMLLNLLLVSEIFGCLIIS